MYCLTVIEDARSSAIIRGSRFSVVVLFALLLLIRVPAQDLPKKIRGYKLHNEVITVSNSPEARSENGFIVVGTPIISGLSLTGITLEVPAEFNISNQSGSVDFVTFHDVSVNGLSVQIEEYNETFKFEHGRSAKTPKPVKVIIPVTRVLQGTWSEVRNSKELWPVTGRVLVFGKFRKFGMNFKRVVPVDFTLHIKNPFL